LHEFARWLAFENARHNIRCNVLMLGMIDTPMAIEGYHRVTGTPRAPLRKQRGFVDDEVKRWASVIREFNISI